MNVYKNGEGVEITTPCTINAPGWELVAEPEDPAQEAEPKKETTTRRRKTAKE